jgi:hypothetical protein
MQIWDLGSGIFLTLDPGSGINILAPQYCTGEAESEYRSAIE